MTLDAFAARIVSEVETVAVFNDSEVFSVLHGLNVLNSRTFVKGINYIVPYYKCATILLATFKVLSSLGQLIP